MESGRQETGAEQPLASSSNSSGSAIRNGHSRSTLGSPGVFGSICTFLVAGGSSVHSWRLGAPLSFQHPEGCVRGWYRHREQAERHGSLRDGVNQKAADARGDVSGAGNPNADRRIYRFRIIETGEIIEATKVEIRSRFEIRSASLCALFNGRQRQTGGISLA